MALAKTKEKKKTKKIKIKKNKKGKYIQAEVAELVKRYVPGSR